MRFVDTSFWIALLSEEDRHYAMAQALIGRRATGPLLTSNHVVGETWTWIRRRFGHERAVASVRAIRAVPTLTVVHVEAEVEEDAWRWLRRRDEREYSFIDATSFAVMRRRRMREALAFDGDFSAAGFVEVRP
ncbi:MAG: PIN domain-containing protein [Actinobacteria bacterium]|nr:PIN domain-containing protein [Actinomycetota bacterium]